MFIWKSLLKDKVNHLFPKFPDNPNFLLYTNLKLPSSSRSLETHHGSKIQTKFTKKIKDKSGK